MQKHTPGPYRVGRAGSVVSDSAEGLTLNGATGSEAVEYYGGNLIAESVAECNAPLLAAAPALLEALELIMDCEEFYPNCEQVCCSVYAEKARAAIMKAKGLQP